MSPDLLELTQNYFLGSTVRQVSAAFGEDENSIGQALRSVLPLAVGVLVARTQQPGGPLDLFGRVYRVNRLDPLGNFGNLLGEMSDPASPTPALDGSLPGPGLGLLRTVLGQEYFLKIEAISEHAGVPSDTVRELLNLAVAVGLGLLGRHAVQHTLDARGLAAYLVTQQATVVSALQALPAGLGRGLASLASGTTSAATSQAGPVRQPPVSAAPIAGPPPSAAPAQPSPPSVAAAPPAPTPPTPEPAASVSQPAPAPTLAAPAASEPSLPPPAAPLPSPPAPAPPPAPEPALPPPAVAEASAVMPAAQRSPTPRRWSWLLVLLLVVVLAIAAGQLYLLQNTAKQVPAAAAIRADSTTAAPAATAVLTDRAGVAAGDHLAYIAGRATLPLAGGAKLRVSNNSAEARLYHFLKDPAQTVSRDNTQGWILLDQVHFNPGTTALTRESRVQLTNLAAILKAYPHAAIKLGGYADDQRSADKNLLLSADCANAARKQLLSYRIGPGRVAAQGYGQAPTRTAPPAGRPQSRRVYVRVLKKY